MQEDEALGRATAAATMLRSACDAVDPSQSARETDTTEVSECFLGARKRQSALRDAASISPGPS